MRTRRRLRSILLRTLLFTLALVFAPYGFSRLLSPWRMLSRHSISLNATTGTDATNTLRLASYNIAHGRGDGPSSQNWTRETRAQRMQRLDEISALLREVNADVVVLNEVDFDSSWSHGINQARHLAEQAGYSYWVEERNLDFRFLFWKWRFGNAVLSRHPITRAEVIDLPGHSFLETILAGKKRGVLCEVIVRETPIHIAGVHLEHRLESVRARSAERLSQLATEATLPFFVIGDLNSSPIEFSGAVKDATVPNGIRVFDESGKFQRLPHAIPSEKDMTFHSSNPRVVIDWILIPPDWTFQDYTVIPSSLSDHRLVRADVSPAQWMHP